MKEIAIISLTRFGDLIQETPLLRILKRTWPGARITMVVERRFAGILPMVQGVDRVIAFNKDEIADKIVFAENPLVPYYHLENFIRQLEEVRYDLVINLTFSFMSAFITSLMKSEKSVGLIAGKKGERLISSLWGIYLFTTQEGNNRLLNRINLVDLFTRLGGVKPDGNPVQLKETETGKAFAEEYLAGKGLAGERVVALQLGASDPLRCWPPEYFARLSDQLQERLGVRTILFGGPGEEQLAASALSHMTRPAISAVGATSIEGLFSLLRRCSLLVTNDTGTMHFAAAGGVPSLMLCIGPAFFHGTGPYNSGNLALQADIPCAPCRYNFNCPAPVCRDMLTVDAVYDACRAVLGNGPTGCASPGVKVYRSFFDADGYMEWERCDGGHDLDEELGKRYGQLWRDCLDDNAPLLPIAGDFEGDGDDLLRMARQGIDIAKRTAAAASQSRLPMEKLRNLGAAETDLAAKIKIHRSLHPQHAQLIDFFSLMRDNITAEDLPIIADETGRCYEWLQYLASRL